MMRYARYAAAALFALLAVGFVALWARSYFWWDLAGGNGFLLMSYYGITAVNFNEQYVGNKLGWGAFPADDNEGERFWKIGLLGIGFRHNALGTLYYLPHWFLAASSLALAALFAFKRTWRYSLRTILVATTLLAGLLGLAVYVV